MKQLGTILPTAKSMRTNDSYALRVEVVRERAVRASEELRLCERRVVGGEVRYYDTADQYAVVTRQGNVIWFAVRDDGDYRI